MGEPEPRNAPRAGAIAHVPRVLIVDDDPRMVHALAETLRTNTAQIVVETVISAMSALACLGAAEYDVVVSDVRMPAMSGLDLLERVRACSPDTLVILITGSESSALTLSALRGGAYDFIFKPVDAVYFHRAVERAIETRALRREVELRRHALERHAEELERRVARRTHDLVEANRIKDEFLATVSHELRTPLTPILGWARQLRRGHLDEEAAQRALDSIERNARAQARLVDDLLDVSRIANTSLRLERQAVSLERVLVAAVDVELPVATAKRVRLEPQIDPDLGNIDGDPKRLQQVFWNLLGNAIKFTPAGGTVRLEASRVGNHVEVRVSDDGIGIDAELLPLIFDRFRQGRTAESRNGLGLGLTIVRHLVELHDGTVSATSGGPGHGSTFVVRLPAGEERAGALRRSTDDEGAPPSSLRGAHVLLVEDSEDTLAVVESTLAAAGARVTGVTDADAAQLAFFDDPPDVVICDIGLGAARRGGCELLHALRATDAGRAVPAIAFTAGASPEERLAIERAGFALHLVKPGPPDLPGVVAGLMGRPLGALG